MRRMLIVVLLGMVTFGASWSGPKAKGGNQSRHVDASPSASQCVCYCKGKKVGVGASACMGGIRVRCQDRDGRSCGWDSEKDSNGNYIRCDGDWCG